MHRRQMLGPGHSPGEKIGEQLRSLIAKTQDKDCWAANLALGSTRKRYQGVSEEGRRRFQIARKRDRLEQTQD